MRTPISSSQCSWYCPKGMVASVACWKTFFVSSARARACMWCSSLVVRRDTDELRGISTRPRVPGRMTIADGPDHAWPVSCCLPSGLSPSVLEFHQVNRPLDAVGSRTVTAGSELHRPRSTYSQYAPAPATDACPRPPGGRRDRVLLLHHAGEDRGADGSSPVRVSSSATSASLRLVAWLMVRSRSNASSGV